MDQIKNLGLEPIEVSAFVLASFLASTAFGISVVEILKAWFCLKEGTFLHSKRI